MTDVVMERSSTLFLSHLGCLPGARLSHEDEALVVGQDVVEALLVLPHRQLQALAEDVVVAGRVGQVGEGVGLLLHGGLLWRDAAHWGEGHPCVGPGVPVAVTVPVAVPVPPPVVSVSVPVTPGMETCIVY